MQCQSCSMPLKDTNHGTEKDGSPSLKFCNLCYTDGQFIDPDFTLDQMKVKIDGTLKEKGWIKPLRWFALMQLPSLERWKK